MAALKLTCYHCKMFFRNSGWLPSCTCDLQAHYPGICYYAMEPPSPTAPVGLPIWTGVSRLCILNSRRLTRRTDAPCTPGLRNGAAKMVLVKYLRKDYLRRELSILG